MKDQQSQLTRQHAEKELLADERQREEQRLSTRASERSALIEKIHSDKTALKETLAKAKQSSRAIESLITRLIARESERKKNVPHASIAKPKPVRRGKDSNFDDEAQETADEESAQDNTGFGALRGSLHWPCASRRIAEHFGERVNPKLGTVTVNLGVDISAPKHSEVRSVADGEVSLVYWMPSFGTIVIIDHQDGYRTVYANLAESTVREGQRVRAQQIIGNSDISATAGEVVHFEIWKGRNKQNPEIWLAKR